MYYLLPHKFRWMLIFIGSCYFYMVFIPKYILVLFLLIIIDYLAALTIEQTKGRLKLFYLIASLTANIGLLGFFKYFPFVNQNMIELFSLFGKYFPEIKFEYILPIGLSFHTFQSMSYTIEVYRGKQKAEQHLGYFANYVLFFPQMVAGPIERYETLGTELKTEHKPEYSNFSDGFKLILFGLFVKMTIADNIAPFINQVYADASVCHSSQILAAILLFSVQIYLCGQLLSLFTQFKFIKKLLGLINIALLPTFRSTAKQDDNTLTILRQVNPISWAPIDYELPYSIEPFDSGCIAELQPKFGRRNFCGSLRIKCVKPCFVGARAIASQVLSQSQRHSIVPYKLP